MEMGVEVGVAYAVKVIIIEMTASGQEVTPIGVLWLGVLP